MSSYRSLAIISVLGLSGSALCYMYSNYQTKTKNELQIKNRTFTFEHLSHFLNQGLFAGIALGYAYTGTPFFYSFLFKKKKF